MLDYPIYPQFEYFSIYKCSFSSTVCTVLDWTVVFMHQRLVTEREFDL